MCKINLTCSACGSTFECDFNDYISDSDWDIVESEEREMDVERNYEATFDITCESCDETMSVTLNAWEYPSGSINTMQISINDEVIEESCDFSELVPSEID